MDTLYPGGTVAGDAGPLGQLGVDGVFPVGTFTAEMVDFIRERVARLN